MLFGDSNFQADRGHPGNRGSQGEGGGADPAGRLWGAAPHHRHGLPRHARPRLTRLHLFNRLQPSLLRRPPCPSGDERNPWQDSKDALAETRWRKSVDKLRKK